MFALFLFVVLILTMIMMRVKSFAYCLPRPEGLAFS